MTTSCPLSYQSSLSVVQYLNSNLRFALSSRSSIFMKLHKTSPMSIGDIQIKRTSMIIDGMSYEVHVLEELKTKNYSGCFVRREYPNGKLLHDVDEFGLETDYEQNLLENADLFNRYKSYENQIDNGWPKYLDHELSRYYLKKHGKESPWSHYLQLRIVDENQQKITVEHVSYFKTIENAVLYLFEKLLHQNSVVKRLTVYKSELLTVLAPKINYQKFPLEQLNMKDHEIGNPNEQVQKTAKMLILMFPESQFSLVSNDRIHFTFHIVGGRYFIQQCLLWGANAEKHITVDMGEYDNAKKTVREIKDNFEHRLGRMVETWSTSIPECIIIPINNDLELNIYFEEHAINKFVLHATITRK